MMASALWGNAIFLAALIIASPAAGRRPVWAEHFRAGILMRSSFFKKIGAISSKNGFLKEHMQVGFLNLVEKKGKLQASAGFFAIFAVRIIRMVRKG
jgi:hypothetical protein